MKLLKLKKNIWDMLTIRPLKKKKEAQEISDWKHHAVCWMLELGAEEGVKAEEEKLRVSVSIWHLASWDLMTSPRIRSLWRWEGRALRAPTWRDLGKNEESAKEFMAV